MDQDIVIVGALRTAMGSLNGVFGALPAHKLGEAVIAELLKRTLVSGAALSEVILGQVLIGGQGQNPTRQASIGAGVPVEVPAFGINQVCGSGLRSLVLGMQDIRHGDSKIVIAGGQESMSQAVHSIRLRSAVKMGDASLTDTMLSDGLIDAFHHYHMGITAENIAKRFNIKREEQDAYAAMSQQRCAEAISDGRFDEEIVPINVKDKKNTLLIAKDEYPRPDTTIEKLAALKPAFDKSGNGTVTAGNASGINDGAAAVMMMTEEEARKRSLQPMARIVSWAQAGVDPAFMGCGPIPASQEALRKAGWRVEDLDIIEVNEAFAAVGVYVNRIMGWDPVKVNVDGGAIALGHPIGASGARLMTTMLHEMPRRNARKGLVTLCIGGGMGIAMCVERD